MAIFDWVVCTDQAIAAPDNPFFCRMLEVANPDAPKITGKMIRHDVPLEAEWVEAEVKKLLDVSGSWSYYICTPSSVLTPDNFIQRKTASALHAPLICGQHLTSGLLLPL